MSADTARLIAQAHRYHVSDSQHAILIHALADALEAAEAQRDTLAEALAHLRAAVRAENFNRTGRREPSNALNSATRRADAALAGVAPPEEKPE